jgi:hypothetical protein
MSFLTSGLSCSWSGSPAGISSYQRTQEDEMRVSTILAIAGLALFAVTGASNAQDMNGMQGNSMGQGTMAHKTMTKKQRMMMMHKQQMMKKQQMMQHNM